MVSSASKAISLQFAVPSEQTGKEIDSVGIPGTPSSTSKILSMISSALVACSNTPVGEIEPHFSSPIPANGLPPAAIRRIRPNSSSLEFSPAATM